jgi:hypothetical protein
MQVIPQSPAPEAGLFSWQDGKKPITVFLDHDTREIYLKTRNT